MEGTTSPDGEGWAKRSEMDPFFEKTEYPGPAEEETIQIPLEDSLDLHSFRPQEIPEVVEEYVHACQRAGFVEVRIIHGRGIGVQRRVVQSLLSKLPAVGSFHDAPAERGGWGATVVRLRAGSSPALGEKEEEER